MCQGPSDQSSAADDAVSTLVCKYRGGDDKVITDLFQPLDDKLRRMLGRLLNDEHAVEDMLQECRLKVGAALRSGYEETGRFSHWVFRIAGNMALDYLRRPQNRRAGERPDDVPDATEELLRRVARSERAALIQRAVKGSLTGTQRRVVLLRMEECPYEEIARQLDLKVETVRNAYSKALHRLRADPDIERAAAGWSSVLPPAARREPGKTVPNHTKESSHE